MALKPLHRMVNIQGKRNPPTSLVEMKASIAPVQITMEIPQKTKHRDTIWCSYTIFQCIPKESKTAHYSDSHIPMHIAAQFK